MEQHMSVLTEYKLDPTYNTLSECFLDNIKGNGKFSSVHLIVKLKI